MKKILIFTMIILKATSYMYSAIGCMDIEELQYKTVKNFPLRYIKCSCPCRKYPQDRAARCIQCGHAHKDSLLVPQ